MSTARLAPTGSLAADTWGISGSQFLGGYIALGVVLTGLAAVVMNTSSRPGSRAIPAERLTPVHLGLLGGGHSLAVTVALAELRSHDLVDATGAPTTPVDPSGRTLLSKPAARFDAVTRAVHAEIGATRLTPAALAKRPAVAAALDRKRWRLEEAGLLTTRPRQVALAMTGALGAGFVALGIARVAAGLANDKPVAYLVLLLVAAMVAIPVQIVRFGTPRLTRSGKQALHERRTTNLHLSPSLHPSWTTYGRSSVVFATALFGGAVMFSADPDFAQAADISDARTGGLGSIGGSSGFGSSGSNSGGGSDCGGGSSCSGGSSCGGGGCGGGGCGG